jgi:hypothetical protein
MRFDPRRYLGLSFAYKLRVIAISAFEEACSKFLRNVRQVLTFSPAIVRGPT